MMDTASSLLALTADAERQMNERLEQVMLAERFNREGAMTEFGTHLLAELSKHITVMQQENGARHEMLWNYVSSLEERIRVLETLDSEFSEGSLMNSQEDGKDAFFKHLREQDAKLASLQTLVQSQSSKLALENVMESMASQQKFRLELERVASQTQDEIRRLDQALVKRDAQWSAQPPPQPRTQLQITAETSKAPGPKKKVRETSIQARLLPTSSTGKQPEASSSV